MATRLPKQVQEQLARADATLAEMNAPPAPLVTETPPAPPAPPPVEQPPPPPPPVPGPAAPAPQPENFEHKYKVLQGMFNQQGRTLRELQASMEQLQAAPPPPPAPPTATPSPVADPKDVETFGLDMVSMVERVVVQHLAGARQAIEARLASTDAGLTELRQMLMGTTQTVAASAEEKFFDKMTELVPDWVTINGMTAFLAFLQEVDPLYGLPRQAALDDAQAKNDAPRAAKVFKAFVETLPPPVAPPPVESPTPRSAAPAQPSMQPDKPIYSALEVTNFYRDVRRGVYRGNPAEAQRLETLYNAAMAEGRIR